MTEPITPAASEHKPTDQTGTRLCEPQHCESQTRGVRFGLAVVLILVTLALIVTMWTGYIRSQQPKVWFDRQWCGLALYKGGYRSWRLTFCDGFLPISSTKLAPVTIDERTGKMRFGYHWPKYAHSDLRKLLFPGTVVTNTSWTNRIDFPQDIFKSDPP